MFVNSRCFITLEHLDIDTLRLKTLLDLDSQLVNVMVKSVNNNVNSSSHIEQVSNVEWEREKEEAWIKDL